ncbi:hypothetical protein JMK10_00170 [Rhodovulum sulfidophilum]|uniref:hypothetical protein n=1 Tax=Rhodovulum sulfidophilum TaxID=35806 RepID=UPI001F250770|nr:hypothetical protein [Rhodovulum sulfidophilum]MCF4115278.1 hypothetical protein [Rhodovulum sulfidophilum]
MQKSFQKFRDPQERERKWFASLQARHPLTASPIRRPISPGEGAIHPISATSTIQGGMTLTMTVSTRSARRRFSDCSWRISRARGRTMEGAFSTFWP